MHVRFWGTRGSIAAPGPGTNHFGGNTSCVEVRTNSGEILVLDCGTGARLLGLDLLRRPTRPIRASIFLGHTHWDHIQGFPFFTPAFMAENSFDVYAPEGGRRSLHETLAGQMEYTYFPVELGQLPTRITYKELAEGTYQVGSVRVATQYLHHPVMTLGYRFEADGVAMAYMTDHEPFSEQLWRPDSDPGRFDSILHEGDRRHARFMEGADLVIHDAQYTPEEYPSKKTWGHSTFEYAVELAASAGVRRLVLTHHDPTHDDAFVAEIERRAQELARFRSPRLEVSCAFEGCDIIMRHEGEQHPFVNVLPAQNEPRPGVRRRILIVGGDSDSSQLISRALSLEGFVLDDVGDEDAARKSIRRARPDLILVDLAGSSGDRVGFVRSLQARRDTSQIPLIVLADDDSGRLSAMGIDVAETDYLTRPFTSPQLRTRVRSRLARGTPQWAGADEPK